MGAIVILLHVLWVMFGKMPLRQWAVLVGSLALAALAIVLG